ncbi:hypothetical protein T484DRAFT_1891247, partial [Baffinella frigidus]
MRLPLLCLVVLAHTSTGRVPSPHAAPGSWAVGGDSSLSGLHPGSRSSARAWGTGGPARVGRGIPPRFAAVALRGGVGEAPGMAAAVQFEDVVQGSGAACPQYDTHLYVHYTAWRGNAAEPFNSSRSGGAVHIVLDEYGAALEQEGEETPGEQALAVLAHATKRMRVGGTARLACTAALFGAGGAGAD